MWNFRVTLLGQRWCFEAAATAWRSMIEACQSRNIRVVLFTPAPDLDVDIADENAALAQHANQIRQLAAEFGVPLVDSWAAFQAEHQAGRNLDDLMSQSNHPNRAGHEIVARAVATLF